VNNHQLDFAVFLKNEGYEIDVVEDCSNLFLYIKRNLSSKMPVKSRTEKFVKGFEELIFKLTEPNA